MRHLFKSGGLRSFCIFCGDDRLSLLPEEAEAECSHYAEHFEAACRESYEQYALHSSAPLWSQADQDAWRKTIQAAINELLPSVTLRRKVSGEVVAR